MKFRWKNHEKSPVQRTFCTGERWKEMFSQALLWEQAIRMNSRTCGSSNSRLR